MPSEARAVGLLLSRDIMTLTMPADVMGSSWDPSMSESVVVVQLLSHVCLFVTPWTAAHQASLSFTISQSLLKLMSIESMMPSSVVPFSSCPQSLPASGTFPMSWFFTAGDQSIGASASASVLPMYIQDLFPLELTGLISLESKGLSRVTSNTTG